MSRAAPYEPEKDPSDHPLHSYRVIGIHVSPCYSPGCWESRHRAGVRALGNIRSTELNPIGLTLVLSSA